jgi:hypothetical protein
MLIHAIANSMKRSKPTVVSVMLLYTTVAVVMFDIFVAVSAIR